MVYSTRHRYAQSARYFVDRAMIYLLAESCELNGWHAAQFATLIDAPRGVVVRGASQIHPSLARRHAHLKWAVPGGSSQPIVLAQPSPIRHPTQAWLVRLAVPPSFPRFKEITP